MNYNQILNTIGISQSSLESVIIYISIIVVVGYIFFYAWKFILAGVFAVGILVVFAHHEPVEAKKTEVSLSPKERFMEECVSLTQKETLCEDLYKERWEE